jgi:hypothetical protein
MTKPEGMTKPQDRNTRDDSFVISASSLFRHSSFGFRHFPHIGTCRKEARETKHFLRMTVRAVPQLKPEARKLWIEAKELHLIFSKIWRSKG